MGGAHAAKEYDGKSGAVVYFAPDRCSTIDATSDARRVPGKTGDCHEPIRRQPALGGPDVGEIGQPLLVRSVGLEIACEDVVGDDRPFAVVLRLPASLWPHSHCILAHQPLDPVQPTGEPVLEHITPDAAGTIGAIAGLEALVDGHDELRIIGRPVADRSSEPGVEA